jgi:uncharacterized protein with HEPN domain
MSTIRSDLLRLHDILDAISAIRRHPAANKNAYEQDEVLRFFYLKQIEIVGEATFKLSKAFKASHPEAPWHKISKTRHILVHDYFDVDWDIVWDILINHLESFRLQVQSIVDVEDGV